MIKIIKKEDCCGCSACEQVCPTQCISLSKDNEGFRYPQCEDKNCIHCGLCIQTCPIINQKATRKPLGTYAVKNMDEQVRLESSSGGFFPALALSTISKGGIVFGVSFNDVWGVEHSYSDNIDGLAAFRGSKYVQSDLCNTFSEVRSFLKDGRHVLFSGTPCQVAGLKLFLKKTYEKLLCVDFVCHGVPSPMVWEQYLQELCNSKSKKQPIIKKEDISNIRFRDKCEGWRRFSFVIRDQYKSPLLSQNLLINPFMKGFLHDFYLRPACHSCQVKSFKSGSDFTIADYWGIHQVIPSIDDDKGVSLVFTNTEAGAAIFDKLKLYKIKTEYTDALKHNPSIEKSVSLREERTIFFSNLKTFGVIENVAKLTKVSAIKKIKRKIKKILNENRNHNIS